MIIEYLNQGRLPERQKPIELATHIAKTSVNNNKKWGGAVQLETMCMHKKHINHKNQTKLLNYKTHHQVVKPNFINIVY